MKILLNKKALILYTILAVLVFLILSPFGELRISKFLAHLTQELIIQEVNPIRENEGSSALEVNEKLTKAAQLKAEDMIARDYFSHKGPDGESPWVWLDLVDYKYGAAGENLAMDVNDPKVLVKAWLNSPSHAKNILNKYFTDIGIGIAKGELNEKKTVVVVMFLAKEANILEEISEKEPAQETIKNIPPEEQLVVETVPQPIFSLFFRFFTWLSNI